MKADEITSTLQFNSVPFLDTPDNFRGPFYDDVIYINLHVYDQTCGKSLRGRILVVNKRIFFKPVKSRFLQFFYRTNFPLNRHKRLQ